MSEIDQLLKKAERYLKSAKLLKTDGDFDSAVSRCYYSMYYCLEALLIKEDIKVKSHKGLIIAFNRDFIKTNKIPRKYGKILSRTHQKRELGDYSSIVQITSAETDTIIHETKDFVNFMKNFLYE